MKSEIRDQRNGNWYWVSRTIYKSYASEIGVIGLALYNAYASYAFEEQKVFPSQSTIAKKLGITKPTLIKYNKVLTRHKLIKIDKETGKSNRVSLLKVRDLLVKEVNRGGKGGLPQGVKEVYPNKNTTNKKKRRISVGKKPADKDRGLIHQKEKKTFYDKCSIKLIKALQRKEK